MGIINKLWKRKGFLARAAINLGIHNFDVIAGKNKGKPDGKKTVVFVRAISDIRIFKQAKALRNTGEFYTVFFTKVLDRNLMRPAFDEIHPLVSVERMVRRIESLDKSGEILVIHTSSPPASICRELIEMRLPWPIIFDQYDSWMVTMGPDYRGDSSKRMYDLRRQIEDEKFCYENADGVVSKTTEIDYIKPILDVTAPTLIYPDYAFDDWFVEPQEPIRLEDGRPHLVYIGGIHGKEVPDELGYSKFFDFARNLNRQRIHFHIYPSPAQTIVSDEYKDLDKELPFFHFHKSKKPWEIQKEIAKYDFGLDIAWTEKAISLRKEKIKTATGIKYSTYLEAGLPIIGNAGKPYVGNEIIKSKLGFLIENEETELPLVLLMKRNEYQASVLQYRKTFRSAYQIQNLSDFYCRISK